MKHSGVLRSAFLLRQCLAFTQGEQTLLSITLSAKVSAKVSLSAILLLFYPRHTARFLEVWLLLMPLTLYPAFDYSWNHWFMIPSTVIISFFLLGIEELGIQLEEPFRCVLRMTVIF